MREKNDVFRLMDVHNYGRRVAWAINKLDEANGETAKAFLNHLRCEGFIEYKAERAGVRVVKVNPRGTSEGLSYENPLRDWISACRIKMRVWDSPDSPAKIEPLQELVRVPASSITEAGNPL